MTSRSLPLTYGLVRSFPVTSLLPPASYSPVAAQMYTKLDLKAFYSHSLVTSGQMTSLPVTYGNVRSFPIT